MNKTTVSALLLALLGILSCRKDYIEKSTEVLPPVPDIRVETEVQGRVYIQSFTTLPAFGAKITLGDASTLSDENGYFRLKGFGNSRQAMIKVEKEGYFPAFQSFVPDPVAPAKVSVVLVAIASWNTFSVPSTGGSVKTWNAEIHFQSGFEDVDGNPYHGDVQVLAWPIYGLGSSYLGIDTAGQWSFLESYGMLQVLLQKPDASGSPLQITSEATIEIGIINANAPPTIPLWYLDEKTGLWRQEGMAVRDGSKYVGKVKHFSLWNCDVGLPLVFISGNASVGSHHPLFQIEVRRLNDLGAAFTTTDSKGNFSGGVPRDEILNLTIRDLCDRVLVSQEIGPFTSDATLSDFKFPLDNTWSFLEATFVDCNQNPVQNGIVELAGGLDTFQVEELVFENLQNGKFQWLVPNCNSSNSLKFDSIFLAINAIDLDSDLQTGRVAATELSQKLGTIPICTGQIPESMLFDENVPFFPPITFLNCTGSLQTNQTGGIDLIAEAKINYFGVVHDLKIILHNPVSNPVPPNYELLYEVTNSNLKYENGQLDVITAEPKMGGLLIFEIKDVDVSGTFGFITTLPKIRVQTTIR